MARERVLVIGATGPLGQQVVAQAVDVGLSVRALVRNPQQLMPGMLAGAQKVRGDVLDDAALQQAASGIDAVVCLLGTPLTLRPVSLLSEGTHKLLGAMRAQGVGRLLCVTGMGAGDSRGHGGWLYDRLILPAVLGRVYADKDRQEALVRASGLDWLLIRPARLTNEPPRLNYRAITSFKPSDRMQAISRVDVAHFIVHELCEPTHHGQTVNLTD